MQIQQIRTVARNLGVRPGNLGKVALVRSIQRQEGNFECFATAYEGVCDQLQCRWREDCFSLAKKAGRRNGS